MPHLGPPNGIQSDDCGGYVRPDRGNSARASDTDSDEDLETLLKKTEPDIPEPNDE